MGCARCGKTDRILTTHCEGLEKRRCATPGCHLVLLCQNCEKEWTIACSQHAEQSS